MSLSKLVYDTFTWGTRLEQYHQVNSLLVLSLKAHNLNNVTKWSCLRKFHLRHPTYKISLSELIYYTFTRGTRLKRTLPTEPICCTFTWSTRLKQCHQVNPLTILSLEAHEWNTLSLSDYVHNTFTWGAQLNLGKQQTPNDPFESSIIFLATHRPSFLYNTPIIKMWFLPGLVLTIASRTCPALFNLLCKTTGFGCDDAQKIAITKIITELQYVLPSPTPTTPIQTTSIILRNSPAISSLAALTIILGLPLLLCLVLLFRYSSTSLSWPIERNSRLETSERTIEHLKSRLHRLTISNLFNTVGRALEVSMKVAEIRRLALLNLALHAKTYTLNLRWEASGRTIQKLKQCIKGLTKLETAIVDMKFRIGAG